MKPLSESTAALLKPMPIRKDDRIELSLDKDEAHFTASIFRENLPGIKPHRVQPSDVASYQFLKRIPEKKELKSGMAFPQWKLAATDYTAAIIEHVWPAEQVLFADQGARHTYDALRLTIAAQEICAENYAKFKYYQEKMKVHNAAAATAREYGMTNEWAGHAPQVILDLPKTRDYELHPELPLAKYQQVPLVNMTTSEGYGLFMEVGTGKTPPIVALICNEAKRVYEEEGRMYRAIVVVPNALRLNWFNEFCRFTTQEGNVSIIRGGLTQRTMQFIEAMVPQEGYKFTVVICSYETMCLTWEMIQNFPWDLAVLDESHLIKWPETRRAQYAFKLRDISKKRVVLTGTPIANTPLDIYSQLEFMAKGNSGFASWKNFRSFYGVFSEQGEDGHKKLVAVQNMPFMKERLARCSFIVRKADVLPDLPKQSYDVHEVEMTSRQADVYDEVARNLAMEIESDLDASDNKSLTVNNSLTKLLRLAQITSGFVVYDKEVKLDGSGYLPSQIEFFVPNAKCDELVGILKEKGPLEKTLIWSNWVPDLRTIKARLDLEGMDFELLYGGTKAEDRVEAERRLNEDPKCRGMVINASVGGVGLNLLGYPPHRPELAETNVTHHIIYAQDWSMIKRSQLEARSHRKGCRVPQRYTDLVVPNTIDEEIRRRVLGKQGMALDVTDIREILAVVLRGIVR